MSSTISVKQVVLDRPPPLKQGVSAFQSLAREGKGTSPHKAMRSQTDSCLASLPTGEKIDFGPPPEIGKNGPKMEFGLTGTMGRKWPKNRKNHPKMGFGAILGRFFLFWGHFVPISR